LIAEEALMAKEPKEQRALTASRLPVKEPAVVTSPTVTVTLCESDGTPLIWDEKKDSGTATISALDGSGEGHKITLKSNPQHLPLKFHPQTWAVVDVEATISGTLTNFMQGAVFVDYGGSPSLSLLQRVPPNTLPKDTSTFTVKAHWGNKDGYPDRARTAEIASATAILVKGSCPGRSNTTASETPVQATVYGATAVFAALRNGCTYSIDVRLKEKYSSSTMPQLITAPSGATDMPIYFEPCQRMVGLLFVDSCGKPAYPNDIQLEGRGQPLAISPEGMYTLTGADVGRVRFSSASYDLRPNEIAVDERMAQAYVVQVAPWAVAGKSLEEPEIEEIVLDMKDALMEDGQATVNVLSDKGKLLETLVPASDGTVTYYGPRDEPVMLQAVVRGQVFDQVTLQATKR
jgi:hypothetical protein